MELELSRLIEALPGLVWTALPDGRAEFLNQRWCEYTGLSLDAAVGFGWHSALHPEDTVVVLEYWRSILESGKPGEVQARLRRYDGAYRRFLFSAAPLIDDSGRVVKWCGTNTDIEERLRAQEDVSQLQIARDALKASEAERRMADAHLTVGQRVSAMGSFTSDLVGRRARLVR
jgi:PAS domain S-box-containing protein